MASDTCLVCGSPDWRERFRKRQAAFLECSRCRFMWICPQPTEDQLRTQYAAGYASGNYHALHVYEAEYVRVYEQFLRWIHPYLADEDAAPSGKRSLLDIGCFTGGFLDVAAQAGFVTHGIELQTEAAHIAGAKHQGRVFAGAVEDYPKATEEQFDVVTAFAVLEHATQPDAIIRLAARSLGSGGILAVQTPDTSSAPARLLGRLWPPYAPEEHLYYFSRHNLEELLRRHGFSVLSTRAHWKTLPLGYVRDQLRHFGPEFLPFYRAALGLLPRAASELRLPFYVGEVFMLARKP